MPKLIPLSSKSMKDMGIVKSKNGFLMREVSKKNGMLKEKLTTKKPERYQKEDKITVKDIQPKQSTQTVSTIQKISKKEEKQRLSDRGLY